MVLTSSLICGHPPPHLLKCLAGTDSVVWVGLCLENTTSCLISVQQPPRLLQVYLLKVVVSACAASA